MSEAKGTKTSRRKGRPSPRERLLDAATALFSAEGIRVIGIDRILREADVAKASLYSLFGSKDNLVIAYLERLDQMWREDYLARTEGMSSPSDKILAFFDKCIEDAPEMDYRGSYFINAATEYPKPETDSERRIVEAVMEHRRWCFDTLAALLEEKNGYPGNTQARQLIIFIDGGLVGGRLTRSTEALQMGRDMAVQMLSVPPADYSI